MQRRKRPTTYSPFHRSVAILMAAVLLVQTACSTTPTFELGSGDLLGTLTAGGKTYQIFLDANDNPSRIVVSDGTVLNVANGSLSMVTSPNGSTFGFTENADGTVTVNFNIAGVGSNSVTVDPNTAGARIKRGAATAFTGNPCNQITQDCEAFLFFANVILPELIDLAVAVISADTGEDPGLVRIAVEIEVGSIIGPIKDFCSAWTTLVLVGLDPCEGAQ